MSKIKFIAYKESEFDFCNSLIKENMNPFFAKLGIIWDDSRYKKEIKNGQVMLCFLENQKVGFLHIGLKENEGYIFSMQVKSAFRGLGLGKKMLDWIINECRSRNLNHIRLNVFKENKAINLYLREGWEIEKKELNKISMIKTL